MAFDIETTLWAAFIMLLLFMPAFFYWRNGPVEGDEPDGEAGKD